MIKASAKNFILCQAWNAGYDGDRAKLRRLLGGPVPYLQLRDEYAKGAAQRAKRDLDRDQEAHK